MNKSELYEFLDASGIKYKRYEHKAVFTVEEADSLNLPNPEAGAKNLFLRDDKKRNYYLVTLRDHYEFSIKQFQNDIGSRRLSFASEDDLEAILKVKKGSVTPFALLNDEERKVKLYLDGAFKGAEISIHPMENTATVYLEAEDLVTLIRNHGNQVEYLETGEER